MGVKDVEIEYAAIFLNLKLRRRLKRRKKIEKDLCYFVSSLCLRMEAHRTSLRLVKYPGGKEQYKIQKWETKS